MKLRLRKIVSGGQTGTDRAALDAAIDNDFDHGGWLPKGRRAEDGPLAGRYKLSELGSTDYPRRTKQNVIDSDGTLIISHGELGELGGGSLLTQLEAGRAGRPCLHLDLEQVTEDEAVARMVTWLHEQAIEVLNVAGPRASGDPAIYPKVYRLVSELLKDRSNFR